MLLRALLIFCVVTTVSVVILVATLGAGGFLAPARVDAAVRALRGEATVAPEPAPHVTLRSPRDESAARELESLLLMAEARERDLRIELDQLRSERRTAAGKPAPAVGTAPRPTEPEKPAPSTAAFKTNLDVLRNHTPRTAAALMGDWPVADIVAYLRAMKPYESADIIAAMMKLPEKGEIDYESKAREIQAELGK